MKPIEDLKKLVPEIVNEMRKEVNVSMVVDHWTDRQGGDEYGYMGGKNSLFYYKDGWTVEMSYTLDGHWYDEDDLKEITDCYINEDIFVTYYDEYTNEEIEFELDELLDFCRMLEIAMVESEMNQIGKVECYD